MTILKYERNEASVLFVYFCMTIMTPSVIVRSQNVIIMLFVETRS